MDLKLVLYALILVAASYITIVNAVKGFLMTVPNPLRMNATNIIQVRFYEIYGACTLSLKLFKPDNNSVVYAEDTAIKQKESADAVSMDVKFNIPRYKDVYKAKFQMKGNCETKEKYWFSGEKEVSLSDHSKFIVFMQTDKPFYKAGQTVKFRILQLNERLRPIQDDKEAEIYVQDPAGVRMAQWKKKIKNIVQLEMPLLEEPTLGTWTIGCVLDQETKTTDFEVKEYVLPTFEVKITPPSFVLTNANEIPIEICAMYTYGKGVEGFLKLNATCALRFRSGENKKKEPFLKFEREVHGCMTYKIKVSLLDPDSNCTTSFGLKPIRVYANFTEKSTGISRAETREIERLRMPLKMQFKNPRETYKPGLPYSGKLLVTLPDDTPAVDEKCELCASITRERTVFGWRGKRTVKYCSNFTSAQDGHIDFTIPAQNKDSVRIELEAKALRFPRSRISSSDQISLRQPRTSVKLRPFFSPSGSFVQLKPVPLPIPCGTMKDIGLIFTGTQEDEYQFFYEIISRGKVVQSESIEVNFTNSRDVSKTLNLNSPNMINDIATTTVPDISELNRNKVYNASDKYCDYPTGTFYRPPIGQAVIGVNVTADLSRSFHILVYYIRDDREVVADNLNYDVEECFTNKVTMKFGDKEKQPGTETMLTVTAAPNSFCGIRVVDKSVILLNSRNAFTRKKVFENLDSFNPSTAEVDHCNDHKKSHSGRMFSSPYEDAMAPFERSGFHVLSDLLIFTKPCKKSDEQEGPTILEDEPMPMAMASKQSAPGMGRSSFSFARKAKMMDSSGTKSVVDVRQYFPEDWLFYVKNVGDTGEFVVKEKLPHTVTEWVGSAICLSEEAGLGMSNNASINGFQAFFMDITLPYSVVRGEVFPVTVSIFNYLDDALAIVSTLEQMASFLILNNSINGEHCIPGGRKQSLTALVRATILGTLNFTVKAQTAKSPIVCGTLKVASSVAADGIMKSIIVEAEGFLNQNVQSMLFTGEARDQVYTHSLKLQPPKDVVPDSERVFFCVTGDLMGAVITNVEKLIDLPTGCGEQNMANFMPNIYVLEYLTTIGTLTEDINNKAKRNLMQGAQRQMRYKHPGGSYSSFGPDRDEGSTFLTAFVISGLQAAKEYNVSIDNYGVEESMKWLLSNQEHNGCFLERGKNIDIGLTVGMSGESRKDFSAPLTAYVLISLLKSGYKNGTVITPALECIDNDETFSPYTASLYAYAYALTIKLIDGANDQYRKRLKSYIKDIFSTAIVKGDTISFRNVNGTDSLNVLTASYTVLAKLESDGEPALVVPIVRWLVKNRNEKGGFLSSQDTVVGLHAISKFAAIFADKVVDIKMETQGALTESILINEDNKAIVRKFRVTKFPSELHINATGTGTVLMQLDFRYNTIAPPEKSVLFLSADFECRGDCSFGDLKICARSLIDGMKTSMGLIEAKMVSGMTANKKSLNELMENKISKVMRYDINNNIVIFYFYEFTNDITCFTFELERVFLVKDCKPALVKVYDYYATENSAATYYSIPYCSRM